MKVEDMQVGYISQKFTLDKYTLQKFQFFGNISDYRKKNEREKNWIFGKT